MSEVDRLSNSGLYPALPLSDQQRKDGSPRQRRPAADDAEAQGQSAEKSPQQNGPRPPKSLIDEYA